MSTDAELIKRLRDSQRQACLIGLTFVGPNRLGFQIFEKAFADATDRLAALIAENEILNNFILTTQRPVTSADVQESIRIARERRPVIEAEQSRLAAIIGERDRLKEAFTDLLAHMVGAASAYREHAARSSAYRPSDAFFATRVHDFDRAVDRARAAYAALSPTQEKITATCDYCGEAMPDGGTGVCAKCYASACENAP